MEAARKRKKGIRLKSWEVVILHCALNCMESRLKGEALDKSIQKAKAES